MTSPGKGGVVESAHCLTPRGGKTNWGTDPPPGGDVTEWTQGAHPAIT